MPPSVRLTCLFLSPLGRAEELLWLSRTWNLRSSVWRRRRGLGAPSTSASAGADSPPASALVASSGPSTSCSAGSAWAAPGSSGCPTPLQGAGAGDSTAGFGAGVAMAAAGAGAGGIVPWVAALPAQSVLERGRLVIPFDRDALLLAFRSNTLLRFQALNAKNILIHSQARSPIDL